MLESEYTSTICYRSAVTTVGLANEEDPGSWAPSNPTPNPSYAPPHSHGIDVVRFARNRLFMERLVDHLGRT